MKIYHKKYEALGVDQIDIKEIMNKSVINELDISEQTNELKKIKKRLERVNDRFYTAFYNLHLAAVIIRKIGNDYYMIDFNKKAAEIDKLTNDDKGKNLLEIYPKINEYKILSIFQKVFESGEPEKHQGFYEFDGRRKGYRNSYIYKLSDSRNEIMAAYEDVSRSIQIKESFNDLFNISNCPNCILSLKDYIIEDINDAFINYFGYDEKEIIGYPIFKNNIIYEVENEFKKEIEKKGEIRNYYGTGLSKDNKVLEGYISAKIITLEDIKYLLVTVLPKTGKVSIKKFKTNNNKRIFKSLHWIIFLMIFISSFLTINHFYNKNTNYDEIYKEYYDGVIVYGISRGGQDNIENDLKDGLNHFINKNYIDAINKLKNIDNNYMVKFYIGSSYMELNDFEKSSYYFQQIIKDDNNMFIEQSEWLMALSYLKLNKKQECISLLKEISKKDIHYKEQEAIELLSKL
jgi:PAS domain-containing protein